VKRAAPALLAGLLLGWGGGAQAHTRGTSYSEWVLAPDGAQVAARVSQLELTRLALDPAAPDYAARAGALLANTLQLGSGGERCAPQAPVARATEDGWVVARWSVRCAAPGERAIRSTLLHDVAPSHLHFARVQVADGPARERVLTFAEPAFDPGGATGAPASFARYVRLGVDHILSGWDHLAFVLALILLATRLREVAWLATAFTAAHSLTLAAAALGVAQVREDAVEAVIGFSIALVAAENLWLRAGRERWTPAALAAGLLALAALGATRLPAALLAGLALFTACYFALLREAARPLRLRVAVAFVFGLAHGFGFAGALAELRLPAESLALGLLGFNAGVEFGQLLVIALAWPLLQWLGRRPPRRTWVADGASACVCALGTCWFVLRAFG
jgi:hydrogenase/urease accessory protein HupE